MTKRGSPGHGTATLRCIRNFKGSFRQKSDLVPFISQILPGSFWAYSLGYKANVPEYMCLLEKLLLSNSILSDTTHRHASQSDGHTACCSQALPPTELCWHHSGERCRRLKPFPCEHLCSAGLTWQAGRRVNCEAGQLPALFRVHSWCFCSQSQRAGEFKGGKT